MCYTLWMPKSYSIDLRERVVSAIDGGLSKMAAHRTFKVSRSTIDHWLALRAHSGALVPLAPRRTRQSALQGAVFETFVQRHRDATLDEMSRAWHEETGVVRSGRTFLRALGALGWTRKKRVGFIKSATKWREKSL